MAMAAQAIHTAAHPYPFVSYQANPTYNAFRVSYYPIITPYIYNHYYLYSIGLYSTYTTLINIILDRERQKLTRI